MCLGDSRYCFWRREHVLGREKDLCVEGERQSFGRSLLYNSR